MLRTTIFVTKVQIAALNEAVKPDGLTTAALIRIFINEGLARRKRKAR
jgi:hypothetical protein